MRVGIVGLGANTKARHVPGLRACPDVEVAAVCNRTPESTAAAARDFGIPKTFARWEELVADPSLDAIVIGTWPYLHCPITVAALAAGKHVLTEARMAMNVAEARMMLEASRARPDLTAQIVPSPVGLRVDRTVRRMLSEGYLGELREVVVLGTNDAYAHRETPLHWRQSAKYSGCNMLALGILHETLMRWTPPPLRVLAQTTVFTPRRADADGRLSAVETPDSVHVLTELPGGARGLYHLSGAIHHGPGPQVRLFGSEGTLICDSGASERLLGARRGELGLREIPIPEDEAGGWRVEAEFVGAIRGDERVEFTDFASGVRYMEFTEAVARSAAEGAVAAMPGTL